MAGPSTLPVNARALIIAAHPDDEVLGAGSMLLTRPFATLHITDGAPRNMQDARRKGFARREDYAEARYEELCSAMAVAGLGRDALYSTCAPDQESAYQIPRLAHQTAGLIRRLNPSEILTHAYEGGHPDHDVCAVVTWAACSILRRAGLSPPPVREFATYHLSGRVLRRHEFAGEIRGETVRLRGVLLEKKRRMLAAFRTQQEVLDEFDPSIERYRPSLRYDFRELPAAELNYEHYDWGLTGLEFRRLARIALDELDLP